MNRSTVVIVFALIAVVVAIAALFPGGAQPSPRAAPAPTKAPPAFTPKPSAFTPEPEASAPAEEPEGPSLPPEEVDRLRRRQEALARVGGGQEYAEFIPAFDFGVYAPGEAPFEGPNDGRTFRLLYNGYVKGSMQTVYRESLAAISDIPGYETITDDEKHELFRRTREVQEHIFTIAVDIYHKRLAALGQMYAAGDYFDARQGMTPPGPDHGQIVIAHSGARLAFQPSKAIYPSWNTLEDIIAGELDHLWEETRSAFRDIVSERKT